jgi:hypothetical protein
MGEEFRPGKYRHYKGGEYVALHLVTHHESGDKFVVYVSCTHGSLHLREFRKVGADSWTDEVQIAVNCVTGETTTGFVPRFQYMGPA